MASSIDSFRRDKQLEQLFLRDVFVTDNVLGTGSYGSVIEVRYKDTFYAAKQVHNILIEHGNMGIQSLLEKYKQECLLMASVSHPNLTKFIGLCYTRGSKLPLLVMEKMAVDLHLVLENVPCLPLSNKLSILHDTCSGLVYLHGRRPPIIHRDLTARNILLTPTLLAKISDLGNSKRIALNPGRLAATLSKYPGTLDYMPPEALDEEHRYGPSLDIFSFGHLSLYTFTQIFPRLLPATYTDPASSLVKGRSEEERRYRAMALLKSQLEETHPSLVKMVSDCFNNNPSGRPLVKDLLDLLRELKTGRRNGMESKSKSLEFTMEDKKIHVLHISGGDDSRANYSVIGQLRQELSTVKKERDHLKRDRDMLLENMKEESRKTAQAEKFLQDQWRQKSEKMVAQAEDRVRREYQDKHRSLQKPLSEGNRKSDTSSELRETREKLVSSQVEKSHLQQELAQKRKKEKELRDQLAQVEKQEHHMHQVAQAEKEELERQWRVRSERLVAQAEERAQRKYVNLQSEYRQLQTQLNEANVKIEQLKRADTSSQLKIADTSSQLREARDKLTSSQKENHRLQRELAQSREKEKELRDQLQIEKQWRQHVQQGVALKSLEAMSKATSMLSSATATAAMFESSEEEEEEEEKVEEETRKNGTKSPSMPAITGGLFGSDDEEDDSMFFMTSMAKDERATLDVATSGNNAAVKKEHDQFAVAEKEEILKTLGSSSKETLISSSATAGAAKKENTSEKEKKVKEEKFASKPVSSGEDLFGSDDEDRNLFGSDDEENDKMLFTTIKTSKPTPSSITPSSTQKSTTNDEETALSSVAASGEMGTAVSEENKESLGKGTEKKVVSNPLFGDDDDDDLDWLS